MKLVNLTPHALSIIGPNGILELPPSGAIARVDVEMRHIENLNIDGTNTQIGAYRQKVGKVTGLPTYEPGVIYVTSALVRLAVPDRQDVVSPGELLRDEQGQPRGCHGLVFNT